MNICPVCGYPGLTSKAYNENNIPSEEICPCCGFQFGYDDNYDLNNLNKYHLVWREKWINEGAKWFSKKRIKPLNWNLNEQLNNLK